MKDCLSHEEYIRQLDNQYYIRKNFPEFQRLLGLSRQIIIPKITKHINQDRFAECEYCEKDKRWNINFNSIGLHAWSERRMDTIITHELLHVHTTPIRTAGEKKAAFSLGAYRILLPHEEKVVTKLAPFIAHMVKQILVAENRIHYRQP